MKKFTLFVASLLLTVGAMAQIRVERDVLLANFVDGQYKWTSEKMTAPEGEFKTLRVTFLENSNNESPAGFPCIAIAEFYLYDAAGNQVPLTVDKFSSNATQGNEGSMDEICDGSTTQEGEEGVNDWYWHSQWSGTPSPFGFHYLEINLDGIDADLSTYQIGWVTRRSQASPAVVAIAAGASTNDVMKKTTPAYLPQVSPEVINDVRDYPTYYKIQNLRSQKYLVYNGDAQKPAQKTAIEINNNNLNNACLWYFTEGENGALVLRNYETQQVLANDFTMSASGEWFVTPSELQNGVVISKTTNVADNNCIDDQGEQTTIGSWKHVEGDSEGTTWILVKSVKDDIPVFELNGKSIVEIGEPATAVEPGKWYILNNVGRGNYVSQEGNSWKMRATSNLAVGATAEEKAGYLFKIVMAEDGEHYNIMSGNGKYFTLGHNSAATSLVPVNFDIDLIGESANNFSIFDDENGYVADGQENGNSFVGWNDYKPASAGGNDSYRLLPVTLEANEASVVYNWTTTTAWEDVNDYTSTVLNDEVLADGNIKYIEAPITVGGARIATVTFTYTGGTCALNVRGIEVIDALGNIVAGDYHVGKAGSPSTNNVYTVKVAEAGTYNVRCYATFGPKDRANETNGTITIDFAREDVANFSHSVTFAAEYATLHLGYKVAIPEGVEAYVVSEVADWAMLEKVDDVIPAATPVILKKTGEDATYNFVYTSNAAAEIATNLLEGSIANRYVEGAAYVLANGTEGVGLYTAELNKLENTAFLNNANKAYLPVTAGASLTAAFYGFNWNGTTGIDQITENREQSTAIYDLTGRRVETITAPGIYVVGGKKVLVK